MPADPATFLEGYTRCLIGSETRIVLLARLQQYPLRRRDDGGGETVLVDVGLHLLDREGVRRPDDDLGVEKDASLAGLRMRSPGPFDQCAIDDVGHGSDRLLDHFEIVRQADVERDPGPLDDRREHDVVVLVRRRIGEAQR